ncbi:hypothetical protein MUP77_11290 [Candidatus Bathyarchaeota archaeon]|nr:hypothetical protein [Candidatus Bathyarchaeota archaeon]
MFVAVLGTIAVLTITLMLGFLVVNPASKLQEESEPVENDVRNTGALTNDAVTLGSERNAKDEEEYEVELW